MSGHGDLTSDHHDPRKKGVGSLRLSIGSPRHDDFFHGSEIRFCCVYNVTRIDRDHYRVSMTNLPQTFRPSMPIEIVDDKDIALLLRRENVDPLVCISVEEIGHETPEMKHKQPQSSHNLHHVTHHHEFHYTHKSNIQVSIMDEFQRSDVPNMVVHFDDIREGLQSPPRHFSFEDTMGNQHISEHEEEETETQFNYIPERVSNRYDEQFAHVQRLVPPPCIFYSINSGKVAPGPVTMRLEVGELFPSKKQLKSQLGNYALANRFQIRVFKFDTTRYQVRCIVEDFNWRLRVGKVQNSDYFLIKKFDNQHTCSTEARFPHQRQASAWVIGEHIQEKFHDHHLFKPKEIIHDKQRKFGISCNYHKGYRARHITLKEVQGTPVESYNILPSYLYMLEQANPGTVTDLHIDSSNRLHKAVGEVDDLVIVFDRKSSITTGVEKVFPNSFHGACAVHLERNMVGHYGRNKALKQYFRRVVRVYRESQFLQRMEQLAYINPEAAQYVTDVGIEHWARAYSPRKRYNIMSTNIAKAMNNAIKNCKELPITGVIDYIRGVLQHWFHDRHSAVLKLTTQLTTAVDVAIDGGLDGKVDLTTKTCTCKEFDVDQLPCAHALTCIRLRGFSFVDYCSPYYSSAFLATAYSGEIHPVGQPSEWLVPEDIASKIVHPPVGRRGPGRPKQNRTLSFGEEVTKRSCTTCHRIGHNSHTCTYPEVK
ncbi:hypothetical protein Ddye_007112 [Dipteronia dyeriana]|uniref:SWIM-type domain-containing protein n=1 Tax=Dipteronia dyeriana TaxID=168575 RepID=A0AAE0CRC3_9ROSI|nr:hypothetical protein Ddye_007112 [Dipteronia dyeriana]